MECGSHDHHWSSSRKLHLHNESDMKCSSLFSHSVERRQPQKWKCTCRESIFNRIAALKARIHVYIHMHIHISVYMQWHPNKSAPKMAPIVELQTWRFSVQSVEFIVTTMKTKINNGIPMVLYPLSPSRLFLCQRQWAMFHHDRQIGVATTARKTTAQELSCALFNVLQIFGKSFYIARV